ncbi:hypothetical protein BDF22DRAFT_657716 [Syncephalis plumigaleata]|nr:hypothetical protein BDF22DRAFT_657716 [Syncephalis plumigaleata]
MSDDKPIHVADELTLPLAGLNWNEDHKKENGSPTSEHEISLPDNDDWKRQQQQDEDVNNTPLLSSYQQQQQQQQQQHQQHYLPPPHSPHPHYYTQPDSPGSSTPSPASSESELGTSYEDHSLYPPATTTAATSFTLADQLPRSHESTRHHVY